MNLEFIALLQKKIHQLIDENKVVQNIIKGQVYFGPTIETAYPFLVINICKIKSNIRSNQELYEVELEIAIFYQNLGNNIYILAKEISNIMNISNIILDKFLLLGMNSQEASFDSASGIAAQKISMMFSMSIIDEYKNE